nr:hypothetical protein [Pseudonocardia sp. H11422]
MLGTIGLTVIMATAAVAAAGLFGPASDPSSTITPLPAPPVVTTTVAEVAILSYRVTGSTALDIAHIEADGSFRDLGIVKTPYTWSASAPTAVAERAKVIAVCPDATAWVTCSIAVNGTEIVRSAGDGRAVCGPR